MVGIPSTYFLLTIELETLTVDTMHFFFLAISHLSVLLNQGFNYHAPKLE